MKWQIEDFELWHQNLYESIKDFYAALQLNYRIYGKNIFRRGFYSSVYSNEAHEIFRCQKVINTNLENIHFILSQFGDSDNKNDIRKLINYFNQLRKTKNEMYDICISDDNDEYDLWLFRTMVSYFYSIYENITNVLYFNSTDELNNFISEYKKDIKLITGKEVSEVVEQLKEYEQLKKHNRLYSESYRVLTNEELKCNNDLRYKIRKRQEETPVSKSINRHKEKVARRFKLVNKTKKIKIFNKSTFFINYDYSVSILHERFNESNIRIHKERKESKEKFTDLLNTTDLRDRLYKNIKKGEYELNIENSAYYNENENFLKSVIDNKGVLSVL